MGCTLTKRATHLLSGMAVGALASFILGEASPELVAVGGLFGILPDLDIALSSVWPGAHRSAGSHSLMAAMLMALAWYSVVVLILNPAGVLTAGSVGAASAAVAFVAAFVHAMEDSLTRHGCRLLYPLSRRRWRGPVRYDDIASNAALSLIAVLALLYFAGANLLRP
jgi:membrane-bound metal-dependent hydrolase YbcI (DUF457 family)